MKVLVINSGSSSLKYTLFAMAQETVLFRGLIDRIGLQGSFHKYRASDEDMYNIAEIPITTHGDALDVLFAALLSGPLKSLAELNAVAHRIGHGGKYKEATLITDDVIEEIRRMTPYVPLHHPAMLKEIQESMLRVPHAIHVAVFDTSFHRTIPDYAAIYAIPYRFFSEQGIRRTGFHGQSHQYMSLITAEYLNRPVTDLKLITCHLGNGASVAAIDRGKSIDTSLGMTSLAGLIMGTRSGDLDPGIIPVLMKQLNFTPDQMIEFLYRECGIYGISGISRDLREIEDAAGAGNDRAQLALNAYAYRVSRYIGSMMMPLGHCDAIVFAGGVGRNSQIIRKKTLQGCEAIGAILDEEKNKIASADQVIEISHESSKIKVLTVQTFEEIIMARECCEVVNRLQGGPKCD